MVIPALPYKFSSPLKCRGPDPDLGEINFLLTLAEIVWTVDHIYRPTRPESSRPLAQFVVVSDGSRFMEIVGESAQRLQRYRSGLAAVMDALGITEEVILVDYTDVLRERLPATMLKAKKRIAAAARQQYADRMWSIFDPTDADQSLRAAKAVEPDPEMNNRQGRFASLFKSLVFTINYKSLSAFAAGGTSMLSWYRSATSHLTEPGQIEDGGSQESHAGQQPGEHDANLKERLRIAMLTEVWQATIDYLAEIKSDRDLPEDPIAVAFPGCLRWTIHPKAGQLALLTSHTMGTPVHCWVGSGALRRTKAGRVMLCTLPVLALEGRGARPVVVAEGEINATALRQPMFYLDPTLKVDGLDALVAELDSNLTRLKAS